jgi:hypothetical protein
MQLVVLGTHRSGTSALARILNLMGCYVGTEDSFNPADEANPKGYWERRDVWALSEEVLESLGANWYDVADVDVDDLAPADRDRFTSRARSIVQRLEPHRPWVIKDPRLCLLFPLWRPLLERPVCVLIYRDPLEVARSLARRDRFPLALGIALWEHHTAASLAYSAGLPRLLISHRELLADPAAIARRLAAGLAELGVTGLRQPAAAELKAFIDPSLYRARGEEGEAASYLNPGQAQLLEALQDGSALELSEPPQTSTAALDLIRAFGGLRAERDRLTARNYQVEKALEAASLEAQELALAQRKVTELERQLEVQREVQKEVGRTMSEQLAQNAAAQIAAHAEVIARQQARLAQLEPQLAEAEGELGYLRSKLTDEEALQAFRQQLEQERIKLEGAHTAAAEWHQDTGRLAAWLEHLDALVSKLLATRRWRVGDRVVRLSSLTTAKDPLPDTLAERQRIMREFRSWWQQERRVRGRPSEN